MKLFNMLMIITVVCFCFVAGASEPMHVTYLWHMHQPIYYPYKNINDTTEFNFSVPGVINDRIPNYQSWPKDAVQQGADRGMDHSGAQMSYSGSLAENCNNLWGYCTGASWDDSLDWALNSLRTSRNNPRLDIVGIGYHHSLMPLTCKESMKMQIRLHQEQYGELWDTSEYSKGFWPPECAFANTIIPALVEEGLEWVIVDNGHLFRTNPDFPWNSASSCRPNPADLQNPSSTELNSQWVSLQNVWAPTAVLAPWSYQPHYVQYVDPWTGTITKIIAVPAGRYEGNENGRGGYGAFKPENVWGSQIAAVNTNSAHPMLLLCHSDGDNYGMKNSDAWNGQHGNFLSMCQSNPDFENTTVQDYLEMYPPDINDVIHIEPGSWIGIDGGTPYFDKWLSSTYVDGECPDRWSWSVLIAAQNRVLLADSLESDYTMNDVEWGMNHDTAKAWHFYLSAETSCYWYWDLDRANPWDGNVTRACNLAVIEADKVITRHSGTDNLGPSIFPPQRDPYNPGGFMWDEQTPADSDFEVWTFVDDVNSVNSVTLYWRTDKDGLNPISSIHNETYAGGSDVNGWSTEAMTGSWDPTVKGPDNIVPTPTYRAQMYKATVSNANDVLIDYFVEAVDGRGNTNRSDIMHVFVGTNISVNAVSFSPSQPQDCEDLEVTYNSADGPLSGESAVTMVITYDNWGTSSELPMSGSQGDIWSVTNSITADSTQASVYFKNGATIDNNSGNNWSVDIVACATPASTTFDPVAPNGCVPITITYDPGDGVLGSSSPVYIHVGYNGWQGVVSPDPAMIATNGNWEYTYSSPVGTYEINCCFNDGAGTWENDNGADYGVAVSNCAQTNAAVVFSPGSPMDCDTLTTTYNPTNRTLEGESPIYIDVRYDAGTWTRSTMSETNSLWSYAEGISSGATNVSVKFCNHLTTPTLTDDNGGLYWSVAASACNTGGPSTISFDPPAPTGCSDLTITYHPHEGPLKNAAQIYLHIGHDGWQGVIDPDPAMTPSGSDWTYVYSPPGGTELINCCVNDGTEWDSNNGSDWAVTVTGCTGALQVIRGDAFDFTLSGGGATTTNQGGFGSFGQMYVNYDANSFYIGADGCDQVGSNNAMIVFLGFDTLGDDADNLWNLSGLPQGLDYLHNVTFASPVDLAIVIGDEWGDGTYTNFSLGDGYDFGQGIYYLSAVSSNFDLVGGAKLSQYDGSGSSATGTNDLDGDRLMNRWEVSIPWVSLNASNGISSLSTCLVAGVIVNSSTNGNDRYISGNYLGEGATPITNGNYGFNMVALTPLEIGMPVADSDADGIPDDWERGYFSSLGVMSGVSDWDNDGQTDRDEYRAGTNPKNAVSCFRATSVVSQNGGGEFVIRWSSASNRNYSIYCATNLVTGFSTVESNIVATPPENVYTDVVNDVSIQAYRIKTYTP